MTRKKRRKLEEMERRAFDRRINERCPPMLVLSHDLPDDLWQRMVALSKREASHAVALATGKSR